MTARVCSGGTTLLEHGEHGALDEVLDDRALAALLERLDLDLAPRAGGQRVEVADTGHDVALAGPQPTAQRVGRQHLEVG